ncbi:MAG: aromatic-ring-hydroxylating dioxygenase subunit beta [Chloroflexi bacterium]|nr:aromatic-ring-hydroxylating dioxygenase subunit beta [Chloroflexota bacterium]
MSRESLQHDVEQFLFHEAELIDHRRLDEWADLFTDDALYSAPNAGEEGDPLHEGFIIYEDRRGITERVRRLQHPAALTQVPPPRTRHMIANVVARDGDNGDRVVTSNQVVYFARQGREVQYPGSWEHVLTRVEDQWRIKRKKIVLLTNDRAMSQVPVL